MSDDAKATATGTAKKGIRFRFSKTTTFHLHYTFLDIFMPSLQDYNVKMPNFTFCGGREHKKTTFFLFPTFDTVFKTSTTENFFPAFYDLNEME